jgi:hypothetical protein
VQQSHAGLEGIQLNRSWGQRIHILADGALSLGDVPLPTINRLPMGALMLAYVGQNIKNTRKKTGAGHRDREAHPKHQGPSTTNSRLACVRFFVFFYLELKALFYHRPLPGRFTGFFFGSPVAAR